jgi:hypothetical protein
MKGKVTEEPYFSMGIYSALPNVQMNGSVAPAILNCEYW